MKQPSAVTHTARQTEIPALLDSRVTNTPFIKMLHPQKIAPPYIFVKTLRFFNVGLLRICYVFFCLL